MTQTLIQQVQTIAHHLPTELADYVACRLDPTEYPENQPYLRRYVNSLSKLPSEVPWALHLRLNFFLMPPAERNIKKRVNDHTRLHTFLLERWRASGSQATLAQLLTFGADQGRSNAVVASVGFLNNFNKRLKLAGTAFTPYQLTYIDEGVFTTPRWEQLQNLLSPELYALCTAQLPEDHALFGEAAYVIERFREPKNQAHPFLGQLVLQAVAMAFNDNKGEPTKWHDFCTVAAALPKVLDEFRIQPEDFDPNDHLVEYLREMANKHVVKISQAYQEGARAVEALRLRCPELQDTIQAWQLHPMDDDKRRAVRQDIGENSAQREQIDLVFNHWGTIHCLAETRALAMRLIMSGYLTALAESPERSYPLDYTVQLPDRNTVWQFRVWTMTSYVAAHPEFFKPDWLEKHQVTSTPFLEWPETGAYSRGDDAPVQPWFSRLVGYQNASMGSRKAFLEETQFTHYTFSKAASYPALNPGALRRLFSHAAEIKIQAGQFPPCLFEPRELWGDVLTALIQLRLIRTNGSRQHEILQLRLESEFLYAVPRRSQSNRSLGLHWKVFLKGDKGNGHSAAVLSERLITGPTAHAIEDLIDLRQSSGHDPQSIRPVGEALKHLPAGRYLFHTGQSLLGTPEFLRRLRFLLFGWEAIVKVRRHRHISTHDLRHAFAKILTRIGFTMDTVADILGHDNKEQAEHYARPTRAEQEAAGVELDILKAEAVREGLPEVTLKSSELFSARPQIAVPQLAPFLRAIYKKELEIRAEMRGKKWQ